MRFAWDSAGCQRGGTLTGTGYTPSLLCWVCAAARLLRSGDGRSGAAETVPSERWWARVWLVVPCRSRRPLRLFRRAALTVSKPNRLHRRTCCPGAVAREGAACSWERRLLPVDAIGLAQEADAV